MTLATPEPQPTTDFAPDRLVYPVSVGTTGLEQQFFEPGRVQRRSFRAAYLLGGDERTSAYGLDPWLGTQLESVAAHAFDSSAEEWTLQGWEPEALFAIESLQALPDGWDSYGGVAVEARHAQAAWDLLAQVMRSDIQLPEFIPLGDGGVQLEWSAGAEHLTFTSDSAGPPELWLSDAEDDRELTYSEALGILVGFRR